MVSYYKNLEQRSGIVSYWYRTGGKYNTAYLQIEKDTLTYIKERVGGWINLQHNGKKGENVVFYTIRNQKHITARSEYSQYFGLSNADNPRFTFWIFMDILSYVLQSNIFFFLFGWIGIFGFNTIIVKKRLINNISWVIPFLTIFLIVVTSFS